jgi:D-aminopeptidase
MAQRARDELPERVAPADNNTWSEGVDAMLQVGFHARAGTANGFVSHTMVPGLRVAVDGAPVTECHIWARLAGLPVLGIAGDAALGGQLDGFLGGTPFLAVTRSASRTASTPVHQNPDGSLNALREFARRCGQARPAPPPSGRSRFILAVSMDPHLSTQAEGRHGLTRASAAVLSKEAEDWSRGAQPALEAAMGAALQPLFAAQADLDLSSEAAMNQQDPGKLQRFRSFFEDRVQADEPTWQA